MFVVESIFLSWGGRESQRWEAEHSGGLETGRGDRQVYAGRGSKGAGVCRNMEEVRQIWEARLWTGLNVNQDPVWLLQNRSDVVYD